MTSSLSSVLAIQGSEDYSAANLFMDSLALNGHPRIRNIQAVQWPAWNDAGMFKSYGPSPINDILRKNAISTQKGRNLRSMIEKKQLGHATDISNTTNLTQPSRKLLVMDIWKEALLTDITISSNFFDLGGNSLTALQEVLSLTESYQDINCQEIEASKFNDIIKEEMEFNFRLDKIPLRIRWLRIDQDHILIFNQHHILTDVCEYAQYQQNNLDFTVELNELKDALRNKKATQIPATISSTSRRLPSYKKINQIIPSNIAHNIKLLAKEYHTTDFVITLSVYILTLRKWKMDIDEDEIIIGCPVAGRCENVKDLIGPQYDIPKMSLMKQIVLQLNMSQEDLAIRGIDFSMTYSTLKVILVNYTTWIINEFAKKTGCLLRIDDVVIINMPPNDSVIAILAVLLTGAAYAPIDPSWPHAKKRSIISNVSGSLVLNQEIQKVISTMEYKDMTKSTRIFNKNHVYDVIYVIHTSGSTGEPKGVVLTHDNVNSLLCGATRETLIRPRHSVFHSVNTVFDVSVVNIIGSMVNGSKLYLHDDLRDIPYEIFSKKCDFAFLTSATFNSLQYRDIQQLECIEKLFVGGESIHDRNLLSALSLGIHVTQIYGPTEGTVWSLTAKCKMMEGVGSVIGKPVQNEECWITDRLPQGELVLSGSKVARGYIGNNKEKKFKTICGKRCYYTGDLVGEQYGTFSYKGRLDNQIAVHTGSIQPFLVGHSMGGTISREMVPELKMWGYEKVFAHLPDSGLRINRALRLAEILRSHHITRSDIKIYLFKSCELGDATFRTTVRMFGSGGSGFGTKPLFGSTSTASTTIAQFNFGTNNKAKQTSAGGGLFGIPPVTTSTVTSGLVGSSTTMTSSGSLFPLASTVTSTSSGLFGSSFLTSAPGGLFSSTVTSSTTQTGGLFTSTPASSAVSHMSSGGVFGLSAATQNPTTTAQTISNGIFGTSTVTTAASAPSGLFGGASTTAQPATGGLFGTLPIATSTSTPGLFGSSAVFSSAPLGSTSSLFGTIAPTSLATSVPGGLFSNTVTSSAGQTSIFSSIPGSSTPQIPSSGIFGSSTGVPSSSQTLSSGIFGTSTFTTAASAASGIFGASTVTTTVSAPSGIFGASTVTTAASAPSGIFGTSTVTTAASAPSGIFGASTVTTAASAPSGLFGGTLTTSQPATGGLFGTLPIATSTSTPGLFGSSVISSSVPPITAANLFGAVTSSSSVTSTPVLFKATPASTNQGLFGSTTSTAGLFNTTASSVPTSTKESVLYIYFYNAAYLTATIVSSTSSGTIFGQVSSAAINSTPSLSLGLGPKPATTTTVTGGLFSNNKPAVGVLSAPSSTAPTISILKTDKPLLFGELEQMIQKMTMEVTSQERLFLNQALEINAYDRVIRRNQDKIFAANKELLELEESRDRLNHNLAFIDEQQRELETMVVDLEKKLGLPDWTDSARGFPLDMTCATPADEQRRMM
uniref:Carrier domain-containing protein n=1 Tax=Heterorhabditis bacteriophora TaxID=37862 RepID=A0A1I7X5Z2_HETBA